MNWTRTLAALALVTLIGCGETAGPELERASDTQHAGAAGKADDARFDHARRRPEPRVKVDILGLETLTRGENRLSEKSSHRAMSKRATPGRPGTSSRMTSSR